MGLRSPCLRPEASRIDPTVGASCISPFEPRLGVPYRLATRESITAQRPDSGISAPHAAVVLTVLPSLPRVVHQMLLSAPLPMAEDLERVELLTATDHVHDLFYDGRSLWAATSGGLERYDLEGGGPPIVYRTEQGLDRLEVLAIRADARVFEVRTSTSWCRYSAERFLCRAAESVAQGAGEPSSRYAGQPVTDRISVGDRHFVATAGAGVWRDADPPERLTPRGQICSNKVSAVAEFHDTLFIGTGDRGLCVQSDGGFERVAAPFTAVHDVMADARAMWIAAHEGLYRTLDGVTFEAVEAPGLGEVVALAVDDSALWAATAMALFRIETREDGPVVPWAYWLPGQSEALERVRVGNEELWLITGDRGALRRRGGLLGGFERMEDGIVDVAMGDVATGGALHVALERAGVFTQVGDELTLVAPLRDAKVSSLAWVDDALYVATTAGGYRLREGTVEQVPGLPPGEVLGFAGIGGRLLARTTGGLVVHQARDRSRGCASSG